jgi:hypothetical protein
VGAPELAAWRQGTFPNAAPADRWEGSAGANLGSVFTLGRAFVALMAVGLLLAAACGGNPTSGGQADPPTAAPKTLETLSVPAEDACPGGKTKPVQLEELIRVFRAHSIVMFDDPECLTTTTERQASNAPRFGANPRRGDAYDEVVATQGWIVCDLFAAPFQPLSLWSAFASRATKRR